ncbi:hypothetical protein HBH56_227990 [Parastagonospora nodorum]|nr:hypothetical protein HBH56_227990 [Parastagonospora nodorum]KAH4042522.1 hypothetical protein HBH49_248180 [Parastagonospora nodorum]KAH4059140.1 hypothetical protein HBH50_228640 [Parastagonospora nodorum]KAH4078800.1 hypothetical protein HBH48_227520 [Parastagonospora nodorum]KAH4147095.1 hypothetical protein HBH44_231920 [Parastagonospora nodorum]
MRIGKGQSDNDHAATEGVAEVDAFGKGTANDGEKESTATVARCDGGAVGGLVCVKRSQNVTFEPAAASRFQAAIQASR